MAEPLSKTYIEMMRAHVDEDGRLSQQNGVHFLNEVERLSEAIENFEAHSSAQFVAGVRRAEMVRGIPFIDKHYRTWSAIWLDEGKNTPNLSWQHSVTTHSDLIADAILAEVVALGKSNG